MVNLECCMSFLSLNQTLESAMGQATTLTTPEDQVMSLMKQVADEAGLDIMAQLAEAPTATPASTVQEREGRRRADDHLEDR
jgi:charged multivesicular body protein 1